MYIVATILLIISISKLCFALSHNKSDYEDLVCNPPYDIKSILKIFQMLLIFDGLIGIFCSLFILL